ncbi:lipocalin family protein [Mucilaginibacter sp. OK098]|uniref:lipocalin family protein n=1 Tax=Mucilaginibacter sp. OK098 TaxID=1855297 RepID=UPI0009222824|nr:lipocalin family protein [Mucilaginibacter sp. OK098]SHM51321.1 Lipocalin-like domain-containing protein [Mucilaginibacter sp. OK098]
MKHKYILLILPVLLLCMQACKKDAASPQAKITVVGKWFITKHDLKLVRDGVQIDEEIKTNYTTDDFAQFFEDGSGYQSAKGTRIAPGLSTFNYKLKGNIMTLYVDGGHGVAETITKLTETEFAIHAESQVSDPQNINLVDTEIDDFSFKR